MKCIVIETSPERIDAHTVTNEDGTPHIYDTMAEARAELKANGYSYNRENQRYYIKGTEYRAYILRADSEEYAEIMEQAEQQAAPENAEQVKAEAREEWTGPDYYRIAYSDGPAYGEGRYYETAEDLAQDLASAYQDATDTHLPYVERIERQPYQRAE